MKQLNLGILVDSTKIDAWQRFALDKIIADARLKTVMVIETTPTDLKGQAAEEAQASGQERPTSLWPKINAFEDRLSQYLYKHVFKHKLSQNDAGGDLRKMTPDAVFVTAKMATNNQDKTHLLSKENLAAIEGAKLDVLVNLSAMPLIGPVLDIPPHGVWEFRYGQNDPQRAVPPGFWEIYNNQPICQIDLVRITGEGMRPQVIKTGVYRTFFWSWNENARKLKYRSSWLLIDSLTNLADSEDNTLHMSTDQRIAGQHSPLLGEPTPFQSLATVVGYFTRIVREKSRRYLYNEKWSIFVSEGSSANAVWSKSNPLTPPDETYWADPFVIKRDDKHYVFFEEYEYARRKGFISYIELSSPLDPTEFDTIRSKTIIENKYHMSYPFLLEHEDELYMIPESSENHTISLWKCDQFPDKWSKQKDLIKDISSVDSTLVSWNGKWWMFTNADRTGAGEHYTELHIYHTDDPINGEWIPHTQNPVVTDVTRARMAGNFIKLPGDRLIRCCQIIKTHYGEAIGMHEVVELTETTYEEKPHNKIEANWRKDIYRNHHTDSRDGLAVIDACRHVFKLKPKLF